FVAQVVKGAQQHFSRIGNTLGPSDHRHRSLAAACAHAFPLSDETAPPLDWLPALVFPLFHRLQRLHCRPRHANLQHTRLAIPPARGDTERVEEGNVEGTVRKERFSPCVASSLPAISFFCPRSRLRKRQPNLPKVCWLKTVCFTSDSMASSRIGPPMTGPHLAS